MPTIRPMTAGDCMAVARLTNQLGYPVDRDEIADRYVAIAANDQHAVLVADEGGDAIGWVHVARHLVLEARDQAVIHGLVVDEAHRSTGLGAELVAAAEEWARRHGATSILVRSRSTRRCAHRFYERLGFVEVKRSHVFEKPLV